VVHKRLRQNLGEENYKLLSGTGVKLSDGKTDITDVVAAGIVAIQGMINTAKAAARDHDHDPRTLSHLTAGITVNTTAPQDSIIYLARATVFMKKIQFQGFGVDASKWGGHLKDGKGELIMTYDGKTSEGLTPHEITL